MISFTDPMQIIIVIVACIALFFILRKINLWYWKINHIIQNQITIIRYLNRTLNYHTTGKIYGDVEGKIIAENIDTGEIKGMTVENWNNMPPDIKQRHIILKE